MVVGKMSVKASEENQFFDESANWDEEIHDRSSVKVKVAYTIAGVASAISLISVFAVAALAPLKQSDAYVIRVNDVTGQVQVMRPLTQESLPQSEAITKYFVAKYVTAREGYMRSRAEDDYVTVSKLSNKRVHRHYHAAFTPDNPKSPINVYKDRVVVKIDIENISFLSNNTAYVPITRSLQFDSRTIEKQEAVTLDFRYVLNPKKEKDRLINPMGFEVSSYRVDPMVVK